MNLLIFDVFRDFGDILVTSLILGATMACYWLVNGLSMACYWSTMRRGGAYCIMNIDVFSGFFSYF